MARVNRRSFVGLVVGAVVVTAGCQDRPSPSGRAGSTPQSHTSTVTPRPCPDRPDSLDNTTVTEFVERIERHVVVANLIDGDEFVRSVEFFQLGPAEVVDRDGGVFTVQVKTSFGYSFSRDRRSPSTAHGRSTLYAVFEVSTERVTRAVSTESYAAAGDPTTEIECVE